MAKGSNSGGRGRSSQRNNARARRSQRGQSRESRETHDTKHRQQHIPGKDISVL